MTSPFQLAKRDLEEVNNTNSLYNNEETNSKINEQLLKKCILLE